MPNRSEGVFPGSDSLPVGVGCPAVDRSIEQRHGVCANDAVDPGGERSIRSRFYLKLLYSRRYGCFRSLVDPLRVNQVRLAASLARRNHLLSPSVLRQQVASVSRHRQGSPSRSSRSSKPKIVSTARRPDKKASRSLTRPSLRMNTATALIYAELLKKLPSATRFIIPTHPSVRSPFAGCT